ncbi:hypothetical protein HY480_04695, partial [Candidatus Uhrbacteria bacterium]|nr:hypothetical protein [Candidatus Uhrbacteria bacterium]
PSVVLQRAYGQLVGTSSARSTSRIAVEFDAVQQGPVARQHGAASLTATGASSDSSGGESSVDMTVTFVLDLDGQLSGKVVFDQRVVGTTSYLRVQDLVLTPVGEDAPHKGEADVLVGLVKGMLAGKWVRIDPEAIADLAKGFTGGEAIPLPTPEARRATQEQVRTTLRANQLLTMRADLGDERVNGVRAYHYRVGIDRAALRTAVPELLTAFGIGPVEAAAVAVFLEDPIVAASIDGVAGEVWIAKKGLNFAQLKFPVAVSNPKGDLTGEIVLQFSEWGRPVVIEAPTDAKGIEELFGGFLGLLGGGRRAVAVGICRRSARGRGVAALRVAR